MNKIYLVDRYLMDRFNSIPLESIHIGICESMTGAENLALGYIYRDIKSFNLDPFILKDGDEADTYRTFKYDNGRVMIEIVERTVFSKDDEIFKYIETLPTFKSQ